MFTSAFPIVSTTDLKRALAFYQDLLDGAVMYRFPEEGDPVYVGLAIGSSHIGIALEADAGTPGQVSLWVYAEDCDAAVERLRVGGAAIVQEPAEQPWGERVARVRDPDGNEIIVGARATTRA